MKFPQDCDYMYIWSLVVLQLNTDISEEMQNTESRISWVCMIILISHTLQITYDYILITNFDTLIIIYS